MENIQISFRILRITIRWNADKLVFSALKKNCHCEPARTLVWQSPYNSGRFVRAFVRFRYISPLTGGLPRQCAHWLAMTAFFRVRTRKQQFIALCGYGRAQQKHPPLVWWGGFALGNTVQWGLRASVDLLPQSCSMKNGKYIQYSRIFHTFACVKISHRISLPHYAVLPLF